MKRIYEEPWMKRSNFRHIAEITTSNTEEINPDDDPNNNIPF